MLKNVYKFTQQEVEQIFIENGCKLIDEFKGCSIPIKFICKCGNVAYRRFSDFNRSSGKSKGCSRCKVDRCRNAIKRSILEVEKEVNKTGCKLLAYIDAKSKAKFLCICGNTFECIISEFRRGQQKCRKCSWESYSEKRKYSIEELKIFFNKNNCELLTKEYNNISQKLYFICKCGIKHGKTLSNFKKSPMCKRCGIRKGERHQYWNPDRTKIIEIEMFQSRCSSLLRTTLEKLGKKKSNKTYDILGYNTKELRDHIKNHPSWEVLKDKKWDLDHIFPIKAFLEYDIKDLKLINCLDNLQPLLSSENRRKGAKYNKGEFENWLKSKNIPFISQINRGLMNER